MPSSPHPPPPSVTVGWREWVGLPAWGLLAVHARVDTGAATSALLALDVERYAESGVSWVRFVVLPLWPRAEPAVACAARVVDWREVTSSSGHVETRPVVRTLLRLGVRAGAPEWPVEVTLADRRAMAHPLLLGREALAGRVVVDPAAEHLLGTVADPLALYS